MYKMNFHFKIVQASLIILVALDVSCYEQLSKAIENCQLFRIRHYLLINNQFLLIIAK